MADPQLQPGLYEVLLTEALERQISKFETATLTPEIRALGDGEAADRLSRHLASVVSRAVDALPEEGRAKAGARLIEQLVEKLSSGSRAIVSDADVPLDPVRVLAAILRRRPDGSPEALETPLTPLLDTTLMTNSPGEPAVGHELRAEIHSADAIDVVMAFVRWSGIRPMVDALGRHCRAGKPLRVVTTTYTNSTELLALDELQRLGADIKVSYDTASTRLHAKAWLFHRKSGYSTAYIGSSNLTHSAHGDRSRVECARVGCTQSRCAVEDDGRLRFVLGERRLRRLRPRSVPGANRSPAARQHAYAVASRDRAASLPRAASRAGGPCPSPRAATQSARGRHGYGQDGDGGRRLCPPSKPPSPGPTAIRSPP